MNEIKRARFNDALIRLLGMDAGPPAPFLAGEVSPTLPIADINSMELLWLNGWRSFSARSGAATGGAGGVPAMRIRNPAASGIVAVVETIFINNTATGYFSISVHQQQLDLVTAVLTSYIGLDGRGGVSANGAMARGASNISTEVDTPASGYPAAGVTLQLLANTPQIISFPVVLTPGAGMDCYALTNATTWAYSFRWRERPIDSLELNA